MPSTMNDLVGGISTSVAVKAPVKAVAISNITLSGEQTVNGVACVAGDRVLVTAQSSSVNNGIYDVSTSAWTRSRDFDGARDIVKGTLVVSNNGTTMFYRVTTDNPILVGTSDITFEGIDFGQDGQDGAQGEPSTLYYVRPMNGTAIKNGNGSLTVEAHRLIGGTDTHLSGGTVKLYVGSTEVTEANGYATGSDGYTGVFDSGDIAGSVTVSLKDGPSGDVLDTITLVDIADGTADTGSDAVYGYVEASNGIAWTRAIDQTTWSPSASTTRLDCTFVQAGADAARVAWLVTRAANGTLTGATTTHGGGDLNGSRVTVTEINEGTQAFTVKFDYSNAGDTASVAETVLTSLSGENGAAGATGATGATGLSIAELAIYKRSASAPSTPTGGSYLFDTMTLTPPSGWTSEIPSGYDPVYASRTVASITGTSGTDATLTWSSPVRAISDGASLDIVFKRNATQPSTPANSSGVPAGWYSDVASVPGSADPMWSSVGSRNNAAENWVWQTPLQVEGDPGTDGSPGLTVSMSRPAFTVQCDSAGVPLSGAFDNATGQITVYSGTSDVTASATYSSTTSNCTGSVNTATNTPVTGAKGSYRVTAIAADTGYLEITVTYNSQSVIQRFSVAKVLSGAASSSAQDTVFSTVSNTSYGDNTHGGTIEISVGPNGTMKVSAAWDYVGSSGTSVTVTGKIQYREKGTSTWYDFSGASATGTTATYEAPDWTNGSLTIPETTAAGPASLKIYEFRLTMYKAGSAASAGQYVGGECVLNAQWVP